MAVLKTSISRELLTALIYVPIPKLLNELINMLSNLDVKIQSFAPDARNQRSLNYPSALAPACMEL